MITARLTSHARAGATVLTLAAALAVSSGAQAAWVATDTPTPSWGTNGRVLAVLPVGDKVYIAGDFTAVTDAAGVSHPASHLAAFTPATGAFDLGWTAGANGSVRTLATSSGQLYIGGSFTSVNGVARMKLAKLDAASGALDPSWAPVVNRPPDGLAVSGTNVYVGGPFTQAGNQGVAPVSRPYLARFSVASGAVDTGWSPTPNSRVQVVRASSDGSAVFVGGTFTAVNGSSGARSLAKVSTITGSLVPGFVSGATNLTYKSPVFDIAVGGNGRIFVGVGGQGGACASVNDATGAVLWSKHANGNLQAVSASGPTVFCGGHFSGAGAFDGQTRYKLASVDAVSGTTLPFAPKINSALGVWSVATVPGALLIGGDFTQISGVTQTRFAQFAT